MSFESAQCPADLFEAPYPPGMLDAWLSLFVLEARCADGNYYPPGIIQNLLAALFRVYMDPLSKVPPTDQFYLQPLPYAPTGTRQWYWTSPLGKNKLQQMFRDVNIKSKFYKSQP
jgi:hypothetical protein